MHHFSFNTGFGIGLFNIKAFLARFLCGGSALREAKSVTNRRLVLARSGIECNDFQAVALEKEITGFKNARQRVIEAKTLDIALIKEVNRLVCPNAEQAGSIRNYQNSVRNTNGDVTYLPPAPSALAALTKQLENDLASVESQDLEMFRDIYVQIQLLHLFADGNGRTARAIYDGLLERFLCHQINPSYYRLGRQQDDYFSFLTSFNTETRVFQQTDYWQKAVRWCHAYSDTTKTALSKCNSKLLTKIGMSQFTAAHKKFLDLLWQQPVITPQLLCKHEGMAIGDSLGMINHFCTLGLLVPQRVRSLNGALVYSNEDILNVMDECEQCLFVGKD